MSFSTTAIKYGWVYLTALGVITGTTIYVASNTRQQVKPEDIIEIALGVHERCLATQITTNPTYSVDPPSIVRTWTDTNGASIIVTNTIGWHTDRAMMVDLDTKIKALCPYYVDTNSVHDGTTNIIMHTFTGLLTSLDLGDHTNFTAIPAIGTNIATYGPWAWRNYVVAWQERYKVLNALKMTAHSHTPVVTVYRSGGGSSTSSYSDAKSKAVAHWATNDLEYYYPGFFAYDTAHKFSQLYYGSGGYGASLVSSYLEYHVVGINTQIDVSTPKMYVFAYLNGDEFNAFGDGFLENQYKGFVGSYYPSSNTYIFKIGDPELDIPSWPADDSPWGWTFYNTRGAIVVPKPIFLICDWTFLYCVDKYW